MRRRFAHFWVAGEWDKLARVQTKRKLKKPWSWSSEAAFSDAAFGNDITPRRAPSQRGKFQWCKFIWDTRVAVPLEPMTYPCAIVQVPVVYKKESGLTIVTGVQRRYLKMSVILGRTDKKKSLWLNPWMGWRGGIPKFTAQMWISIEKIAQIHGRGDTFRS